MSVNPAFQRLSLLIGDEAVKALSETKVHVFGLGGVGSYCAEALVRSGIGNITLIDFDIVDVTNINRQVEAVVNTVGQKKTESLAARLKEINPDCKITVIARFFSSPENGTEPVDSVCASEVPPATTETFGITETDYVIDAIDTMNSKLDLIETVFKSGVTLYSSMGMARKLDPTMLKTCGIWETQGCPLARNVREGLRKRGFTGNFIVVYSDEKFQEWKAGPDEPGQNVTDSGMRKKPIGSAIPVTASAGMILASLVIRDVYGKTNHG